MAAGSARDEAGVRARTAARILDVAEGLVQVRGFNGFSYADISAEVGITKAALHYHFSAKADLGLALITRYAGRFAAELARIDTSDLTPGGPPCRVRQPVRAGAPAAQNVPVRHARRRVPDPA